MKKNIIILALALLTLSSCKSLYTKYERPDVNTKGLVRDPLSLTDTLAVKDTASFGNLPWRQVFTDPQLQSLIETGLRQNADLLNAALSVKMVNEALKVAKLAFLPGITFTPQGTISSWDYGKATKSYSLPVTASWNVDLFGNLLNQKRSAQMQLLATQDYKTVVQTNIVCNVANLYYTLLMLDRQLEILGDMGNLTKDTWEKMQIMKESRIGYRSTAVQSAEANYLSVEAQKADLKRQIREVENSLSLLIGQPAQTIARGNFDRPVAARSVLYGRGHSVAQQPCRRARCRDAAGPVLLRHEDCTQPLLSQHHHLRFGSLHQQQRPGQSWQDAALGLWEVSCSRSSSTDR